MSHKLVSIIIPVRNRSALMRNCMDSIVTQTYPYIETIVVDGNSTDDTVAVCESYAGKNDVRVIVYPTPGDHRCAQRNMGVREARGEYVLILDSDMELSPRVVEDCVAQFDSRVSGKSGVCGVIIPEESFGEGFWAQCKKLEKSFYVGVDWMEAARFFRKVDFLQEGGYVKSMTSGEDWDLSQRISNHGRLGRTKSFVRRNEGKKNFLNIVLKKFHSARYIRRYINTANKNLNSKKQISVIERYALYFSDLKRLFRDVEIGIGMLLMTTAEFISGAIGFCLGALVKKKVVVITYGTFDLFHVGHLNLLNRAASLGDVLIVAVSSDEFNEVKGKKTVVPYSNRAEIVGALEIVDMVIPENDWNQKIADVREHDVDLFVMGHDWEGKFDFLLEYCEVTYLPRTDGISTTMLKKISKNYL